MHLKILDNDGTYAFIDETTALKELLLGTVPISEATLKELMENKCKISVVPDLENTGNVLISIVKIPLTTDEKLDKLLSLLTIKGVLTKTEIDSVKK